jgi:phage-related protein (TIGR01555 family)
VPTQAASAQQLTIVDTIPVETRLNSLADLATPDMMQGPFQAAATSTDTMEASADFGVLTLNRILLSYAFKTFGLVDAVCSVPVNDAFRGKIKIEIPEITDKDDLEKLYEVIEREGDWDIAKQVATWDRLFGGAGLIAVTDQDPSTPLNEKKLHGGKLQFLAADRWELILGGNLLASPGYASSGMSQLDLARSQYGYTGNGRYNYYGVPLDESRVTKITGRMAPSIIRQRLQGWGLSVLEQCMREIQSYIKFQNMLFELVDEAKIDIHRIEGFNDLLATPDGTSLVKLRISLANWIKNYKNALVMDKLDEFEQKQIAFSGLADILVEFRINLCASLKIPYNKLFGQSATGFASGEDSLENYNSMIDGEIRDKIRQVVRRIISLRCIQVFGYEPKFSFEFATLRVMNATEEEGVKSSKQNRVMQLRGTDQITGKEADEILRKEGLLTIDTEVGKGLREPMAEGQEEDGEKPETKPSEKQNSIAMLRNLIRADRSRHAA